MANEVPDKTKKDGTLRRFLKKCDSSVSAAASFAAQKNPTVFTSGLKKRITIKRSLSSFMKNHNKNPGDALNSSVSPSLASNVTETDGELSDGNKVSTNSVLDGKSSASELMEKMKRGSLSKNLDCIDSDLISIPECDRQVHSGNVNALKKKSFKRFLKKLRRRRLNLEKISKRNSESIHESFKSVSDSDFELVKERNGYDDFKEISRRWQLKNILKWKSKSLDTKKSTVKKFSDLSEASVLGACAIEGTAEEALEESVENFSFCRERDSSKTLELHEDAEIIKHSSVVCSNDDSSSSHSSFEQSLDYSSIEETSLCFEDLDSLSFSTESDSEIRSISSFSPSKHKTNSFTDIASQLVESKVTEDLYGCSFNNFDISSLKSKKQSTPNGSFEFEETENDSIFWNKFSSAASEILTNYFPTIEKSLEYFEESFSRGEREETQEWENVLDQVEKDLQIIRDKIILMENCIKQDS